MFVKGLDKENHIDHLKAVFEVLRHYKMMQNPGKCIYGVGLGKLLGLMVSKRGIKDNLYKIKDILDIEPPRAIKDVQKLAGSVAALGRFTSKSGDKCFPFLKNLKKVKDLIWSDKSQVTFEELKEYMAKAPLLAKPNIDEILYLYLAVSRKAVSAVLLNVEAKI